MGRVLIKDISDATRKLAKVINQYEADRMKTEKFRSLVYGISKYIEAIYKYDIEQRLNELEKTLKGSNEFR